MNTDPKERFIAIARDLQKPAGDSPLFSTREGIRANQAAFNRACHVTWKRLHLEAINELLVLDQVARIEKAKAGKRPSPILAWTDYSRALWRKVSDAIIWELCGMERHLVKRLCLYRERGHLSESNAPHALATLQALNAAPDVVAIWNDATSCVDVGDVTVAHPGGLVGIELKEGKVNEEVMALLSKTGEISVEDRQRIETAFGPDAVKQLDRAIRQDQRNRQVEALIRDERGIDPVSGREIVIGDLTHVEVTSSHEVLEGLLREALASPTHEALRVVDGCLWVYAHAGPRSDGRPESVRFAELLSERSAFARRVLSKSLQRGDYARIAPLEHGAHEPLAVPLFLRLAPDLVGEVMYGAFLHGRVQFFLDWDAFAELFAEVGAKFIWREGKEARRARSEPWAMRRLIVDERLPMVEVGEAKLFFMGTHLIQLYFDGMSPRTLIRLMVETAEVVRVTNSQESNVKEA